MLYSRPMQDLQDIWKRLNETKAKQKKIRDTWRDVLAQNKPYQDVIEKLIELKAKKMQIETELRRDMDSEFNDLEQHAEEMKSDKQLLADISLNKLVRGEVVEIKDDFDVVYVPLFSVRFQKST